MEIMKKRNKKHNKMRDALASARIGLKNLAVFHSQSELNDGFTCIVVNYKTAKQVTVGQSMAYVISEVRHKWAIHMIAVGVESNGKSRFEVEEMVLPVPLLQSQLVDYLNEHHQALADEFAKRNKLTNLAWLAVPNGDSISNEQIDKILTKYKAW
jgi:hypothetical protein